MHRTNNIILLQAAEDLSRELRKSQTGVEKFFLENTRKNQIKKYENNY
jgi:hypothetical protein